MASILIVDDDASMRGFLRSILEADGHQIFEAGNGHLGLLRYREAPTDLVITDLLMPERDGMELILALTKEYRGVRIIAITGATGGKHFLEVATLLGARQVVQKPFTPDELRRVVQRTLEGSG